MARVVTERTINVIASEAKQSRVIFCRPRFRDCFVALRAPRNDNVGVLRYCFGGSEFLAEVVIHGIAAAAAEPDRHAEQGPHQRELVAAVGPEVAVLPL